MQRKNLIFVTFALLVCLTLTTLEGAAQTQRTPVILTRAQLTRVVPAGFYFEGQSAPTQMRNAVAARFGENHHLILALVDTSGYSAETRAKYEGFLVTDTPLRFGDQTLPVGAYGFGFSDDNKMNVFDISGKEVLSVPSMNDRELRRPRPLMLMNNREGLRLYSGRAFVIVTAG